MAALQQRCDTVHVFREGMLARNEVSHWTPDALIDRNDRRGLHQMLYGWNGFRMAGMKIEIAIADGENGSAATARQASRTIEGMLRVV